MCSVLGKLRGRREHVQLRFAIEKAEDRRLHELQALGFWENISKVSGRWRWGLAEEEEIFILERDVERRCHAVQASSLLMHSERYFSCTMCGQWFVLRYTISYMVGKSAERSMLLLVAPFHRCFRNSSRLSSSSSGPLRFLTTWPGHECILEISLLWNGSKQTLHREWDQQFVYRRKTNPWAMAAPIFWFSPEAQSCLDGQEYFGECSWEGEW